VKLENTARQSAYLDLPDVKQDTIVTQDLTMLLQIFYVPSAKVTFARKDILAHLVSRSKHAKMELSVRSLERAHVSPVQRASRAKIRSTLPNVMTIAIVNVAELRNFAVLENSTTIIVEHQETLVKSAFPDITVQVELLASSRYHALQEKAALELPPKWLVNQEDIALLNPHCPFFVRLERNVLIQQLQSIAHLANTVHRRAPSLIVLRVISAILIRCTLNHVRWELTTINLVNQMRPLLVRTAATADTVQELERLKAPRASVTMGTTALIPSQISWPRPLSVQQAASAVILAKQNYVKKKLTLRWKDRANASTVQMDSCAMVLRRLFLLLVQKVVSVKMAKKISVVDRLLAITGI